MAAPPSPTPSPSPTPIGPTCPLSGLEPKRGAHLRRPAVAIKVVNVPAAYPLSGLEDAELVFEEVVEGGVTRFMALYHCTDADRVGPIRSVRAIDVPILAPLTGIMAASGGNPTVLSIIRTSGIYLVEEFPQWASAVMRIPRPGISRDHTLYAKTAEVRRFGMEEGGIRKPPPRKFFTFGDLEETGFTGRKAERVSLTFGRLTTVIYEWNGSAWERAQDGVLFQDEDGDPIEIDNVIIEEHTVNNSDSMVDVAGNPSPEIADETGSGVAFILRDGVAVKARWVRDAVDAPTRYEKDGQLIPLKSGRTWIALFPGPSGEVTGSYKIKKNKAG